VHPIIASPLPEGNGYTWTVASRISHALAEAEARFGPRDPSYFLAGWEFVRSYPRIWYPGDRKHVVIQLGLEARGDVPRLVFQLSHEVVHLLSPTGRRVANNLEEGLATLFAEDYTLEHLGVPVLTNLASYARARDAVRRLLARDPTCIRRLREGEPCLSHLEREFLRDYIPDLSGEDAAYLLARFERGGSAV
jgi:hypothetical protein